MAPTKQKNTLPDSLAASPAGSRTLTRLIAAGVIKPGYKPQTWYNHPQHCQSFAPIHPDKFRKRFRNLLTEKYNTNQKTSKYFLLLSFINQTLISQPSKF